MLETYYSEIGNYIYIYTKVLLNSYKVIIVELLVDDIIGL